MPYHLFTALHVCKYMPPNLKHLHSFYTNITKVRDVHMNATAILINVVSTKFRAEAVQWQKHSLNCVSSSLLSCVLCGVVNVIGSSNCH